MKYVIIIMAVNIFCSCNSDIEKASPIAVIDQTQRDSISNATDNMIGQMDSIGVIIDQKVN